MNTVASQVTFLIALLLQNTQSRDTRALQLKLDELMRSTGSARKHHINLEDMDGAELDSLEREFQHVRPPACRECVDDVKTWS